MQWSKLKERTEERFAPSLHGRVAVYNARYRHSRGEYARGWITVDGREVADMSDLRHLYHHFHIADAIRQEEDTLDFRDPLQAPGYYAAEKKADMILRQEGVYTRRQFDTALFSSLSLSIDAMLESDNAIIHALAVLDSRLGKRRLRTLTLDPDENQFIRALYDFRCQVEGIPSRNDTVLASRVGQASQPSA